MNKYIFYGALISFGLFLVSIICYSRVIHVFSKKTYTVNLMESSYRPNALHIPVTINDSIYRFMFDTKSSHNVIDSGLAQKIGLNDDGTFFSNITFTNGTKRSDSIAYVKKRIGIGNFKLNSNLVLNGHKGLFARDTAHMQKVGAIMGMEIIQQYKWLFNFADNTVSFSSNEVTIPALPDGEILTFEMDTVSKRNRIMNLTIGGVTIQDVVFDTGSDFILDLWDRKKNVDIIFSKPDFEIYSGKPRPSTTMHFGENAAYLTDSILINGFTMQGFLAFVNPEYEQTRITANFVRRFRMMYFDSTNRKIELYVSPSDSIRHHRRDLQNFLRETFLIKSGEGSMDKTIELWQTNIY